MRPRFKFADAMRDDKSTYVGLETKKNERVQTTGGRVPQEGSFTGASR